MDLKQAIVLVALVSVVGTVFGFGLKTTGADLLHLLRRPGLLARSLLSALVIMPAIAVLLVRTFDLPPTLRVVLIALAISPIPPLLPTRQTKAGADDSYGLALMAFMALLAIVVVPVSLEIMELIFARPLGISPAAVAVRVGPTILVPLMAGMAVRALRPALAEVIEKVVKPLATVLLVVAVLALVAGSASSILALAAPIPILAIVLFTAAGVCVGHVLGGPEPGHSTVLALSTACRHPAIALSIATTNFPDQQFGPLILLYVLVGAVGLIPYLMWQRRRTAAAAAASP